MSRPSPTSGLQALLAANGLATDSVTLEVRSATRVDVGSWFGGRRVSLVVADRTAVFAAPGPRPYVESLPLADLAQSAYNHVTGCLVCAPRAPACGPLRLPPDVAARVLGRLQG